ncbi:hypothetical protein EJB05_26056, partial [Eragrostis curvula]
MMIGATVHSQPCRVAEVLLAPLEPIKKQGSVKWPPSSWRWHALSSRTKRWEERVFVREGEVAGTVTTLKLRHWKYDEYDTRWRYSVDKAHLCVWILDESEEKRTLWQLKHDNLLDTNAWWDWILNNEKKYDYV